MGRWVLLAEASRLNERKPRLALPAHAPLAAGAIKNAILRERLPLQYQTLHNIGRLYVYVATMVKKSKLLAALDAHKGRNYELERQKALQKKAEKRKRMQAGSKSLENGNADQSVVNDDGSEPQVDDESESLVSDVSVSHLPLVVSTIGSLCLVVRLKSMVLTSQRPGRRRGPCCRRCGGC